MKLAFCAVLLWCASAQATTYYIDFVTGSDANNGTAKGTPWKRSPGMTSFAGSYSHAAGDRFIFKGGVTWDHTAVPLVPAAGGSVGKVDYYGVDLTWFTGGAFTRPIFDNQLHTEQGVINISNLSYITVDNLEIKNSTQFDTTANTALIFGFKASNITIQNCFLHSWTTNAVSDRTQHGGIYGGSGTFTVTNNIISNTEHSNNGNAITNVHGTISNNTIHDMPTGMLGVSGTISGNTLYNINYPVSNFDGAAHTNVIYTIGGGTAVSLLYKNLAYNTSAGAPFYIEPCWGEANATYYLYDNVYLGSDLQSGGGGMFSISNEGGTGASCGRVYVYNNTLESRNTAGIRITGSQASTPLTEVVVENNHSIAESSWITQDGVAPVTFTNQNNTNMTHSQAAAGGYSSRNNYAPTSLNCNGVSSCTVGAGLNLSTSCGAAGLPLCSDRLGVSRPTRAWGTGAYEYSASGDRQPPAPPTGLSMSSH